LIQPVERLMGTTMAVFAADVIDCALRASSSSEFSRGFVERLGATRRNDHASSSLLLRASSTGFGQCQWNLASAKAYNVIL